MGETLDTEDHALFSTESPTEVFCDSNILINYLNQEWEGLQGTELVTSEAVYVIISHTVEEELNDLVDRRLDMYGDFLQYLLGQQGKAEEYTPDEHLEGNDKKHLETVKMTLAGDDPAESYKRLREFTLKYRSRADQLLEQYVHEVVFTSAPLTLTFELDDLIPNSKDVQIIAGAADWSDQEGSGVLATNDTGDIVDRREEINDLIEAHFGDDALLYILRPREFEAE
jgi:hypothetical protein